MSQDRLNHEMHELVCMTKDNYVPRKTSRSQRWSGGRRGCRKSLAFFSCARRARTLKQRGHVTSVATLWEICEHSHVHFHRLLPTPHTHTYTHQPTHIHLYPPTFTFTHIQCLWLSRYYQKNKKWKEIKEHSVTGKRDSVYSSCLPWSMQTNLWVHQLPLTHFITKVTKAKANLCTCRTWCTKLLQRHNGCLSVHKSWQHL